MCIVLLSRSLCKSRSLIKCEKYRMSLQHSSVAWISDSAEDLAVIDWRLEDQCTGPCNVMTWPEIDRDLCSSRSESEWKDVDWSCAPQFASEIPARVRFPWDGN